MLRWGCWQKDAALLHAAAGLQALAAGLLHAAVGADGEDCAAPDAARWVPAKEAALL
jgi:hypothetical protein